MSTILVICALFFLVALLYSAVGHGGASGYIAVLSLLNFAPEKIKPLALLLNIIVSAIAFYKFYRSGYFNSRTFLLLIITSAPSAFLGGYLPLGSGYYKIILGIVLLFASIRLLLGSHANTPVNAVTHTPPVYQLLFTGSVLGFISGITGVGGGIFLSPLLLIMRWANAKETAALSAGFIFINSTTGLLGKTVSGFEIDNDFPVIALAVILGGYAGSEVGSKKLNPHLLIKLLGIVMLIAALKLICIL